MKLFRFLLSQKNILFGFLFLSSVPVFLVNCQKAALTGVEPVQSSQPIPHNPSISKISLKKNLLTITGENLENPTSIKIQELSQTAQPLNVQSSSSTSLVATTSSALLLKLNTVYSVLVSTSYGDTTASFTVDLSNVSAGSFSVGASYLTVTANGSVGIGTAAPPDGVVLAISSDGGSGTSVMIPKGTTSTRPAVPLKGMIRYNTDLDKFEFYDSSGWYSLNQASTVKCNSQYITSSSVSGAGVGMCTGLMQATILNTNTVSSVAFADGNTSSTSGCAAENVDYPGTLVTILTTGITKCNKRCKIVANCDANGQWVSPTVTLAP
jgi:hypothetical protein